MMYIVFGTVVCFAVASCALYLLMLSCSSKEEEAYIAAESDKDDYWNR